MDRIGHCCETGFAFFGKQHLVHKAFKLFFFHSDNISSRVLVFENALVKM